MVERRRAPREHVYYGATLAYNTRASTSTCLVRNLNEFGAKIQLDANLALPEEVDIAVERKQLFGKARMVWRDAAAVGLVFTSPLQQKDASSDWKRRLQAAERNNQQLRVRLEQLLTSN